MNTNFAIIALVFLSVASAIEFEMTSGRNLRNLGGNSSSPIKPTKPKISAVSRSVGWISKETLVLQAFEANLRSRQANLTAAINAQTAREARTQQLQIDIAEDIASTNAREAALAAGLAAYNTALNALNARVSASGLAEANLALLNSQLSAQQAALFQKWSNRHKSSSSSSGKRHHHHSNSTSTNHDNVQISLNDDAQQTNDGNNVNNVQGVVTTQANANSNSGLNNNNVTNFPTNNISGGSVVTGGH